MCNLRPINLSDCYTLKTQFPGTRCPDHISSAATKKKLAPKPVGIIWPAPFWVELSVDDCVGLVEETGA